MTALNYEMKASFAFVERNFNLTKRYWGWEAAFLVYAVAGALSITLIGPTITKTKIASASSWLSGFCCSSRPTKS